MDPGPIINQEPALTLYMDVDQALELEPMGLHVFEPDPELNPMALKGFYFYNVQVLGLGKS